MKKYSLYLFDFDGTLFDTLDSLKESYRDAFLLFNVELEEKDYPILLGKSLYHAMDYKNIDRKYKDKFVNFMNDDVASYHVISKSKLYDDTLPTFKFMNENKIKYGIVSGSTRRRMTNVLDYFKIDKSNINPYIGFGDYIKPKPDGEPILAALKQYGFLDKKNEVVYIGDALQDELCAKDAGVDFIYIKRDKETGENTVKTLLDLFK